MSASAELEEFVRNQFIVVPAKFTGAKVLRLLAFVASTSSIAFMCFQVMTMITLFYLYDVLDGSEIYLG